MKTIKVILLCLFFPCILIAQTTTVNPFKSWEQYRQLYNEISKISKWKKDFSIKYDSLKIDNLDFLESIEKLSLTYLNSFADTIDFNATKINNINDKYISQLKHEKDSIDKAFYLFKATDVDGKIKILSDNFKTASASFDKALTAYKITEEQNVVIDKLQNEKDQLQSQIALLNGKLDSIPTSTDIENTIKARFNSKNFHVGVGLMVNFNDKAADNNYFISTDTLLITDDNVGNTGLNFGLIFSYRLPIFSELIYFQTSIPLINLIDPTGSPTTILTRTSGAVGFGWDIRKKNIRKQEKKPEIMLSTLINFGSKSILKSGKKNLYLNGNKSLKFPADIGEDILPSDKKYEAYFEEKTNISFMVGITVLF